MADEAYEIKTPGAALGVRGTVFDGYVADNGAMVVLLHEGAVNVCTQRCLLHKLNRQLVYVTKQGKIIQRRKWDSQAAPGREDPGRVAVPWEKADHRSDHPHALRRSSRPAGFHEIGAGFHEIGAGLREIGAGHGRGGGRRSQANVAFSGIGNTMDAGAVTSGSRTGGVVGGGPSGKSGLGNPGNDKAVGRSGETPGPGGWGGGSQGRSDASSGGPGGGGGQRR